MRLHDLTNGFIQLELITRKIAEMEQNGEPAVLIDELKEKLAKEFETAEGLLENKLDNTIKMIINEEATIEALKKEGERLIKRAKSRENSINYFKRNVVLPALRNMPKAKYKSDIGTLYELESKAVEISSIDIIPKKFKEKVIDIKILKGEIKEALKNGKKVKGALLKTNHSLVFRK